MCKHSLIKKRSCFYFNIVNFFFIEKKNVFGETERDCVTFDHDFRE